MLNLTLPAYQSVQQVTVREADIRGMSVEQCLDLRHQLQAELKRWNEVNPAQIAQLLGKVSERLFEVNYHLGMGEPQEAHEG